MNGFRLIVAEKPSVARDIARVLGIRGRGDGSLGQGDTRVTWCVGHLAELAQPVAYDKAWKSWRLETLPMLPEQFKLKARKGARDQYKAVRTLLRDKQLGEVVNACDAGREGELIFANVYQLTGCKAPVLRLWISSMTDAAIRRGFEQLRTGVEMQPLEDAARCRSEADWLVGLNATRAMSLRARQGGAGRTLLSLGRVQTPTLALLADREAAIEAFVPRPFWQVKARFAVDGGQWEALWVEEGEGGKRRDRLDDRARADEVIQRVAGRQGQVSKVERRNKREKPPLLYDLTNLQKEANRRFRFTAKRTLALAQALYERHKLLTYPRTDSRHLTHDQVPGIEDQLKALRFGPYEPAADELLSSWPLQPTKRVVDDKEVSDHHAIVPTGGDPRECGLTADEKRLFDLVARRFLAAFLPDAVFAITTIDTAVGDDLFAARGRIQVEPGWQSIDPPKRKGGDDEQQSLPPVQKGQQADLVSTELHEGTTKPPKRFTEATLLGAMERAGEALEEAELKRAMKRGGLGTPATRAAIIETLLQREFVTRKRVQLLPTAEGRALIAALPVEALRSPRLTGEWEARLVAVAEGREQREVFMADIRRFTAEVVTTLRGAEMDLAAFAALGGGVAGERDTAEGDLLGSCPRCGGEVRADPRGWSCGGCEFRLFGTVARRVVSTRMARQLLGEGVTAPVSGFRSKKGGTFRAALRLDPDGKLVFEFPQSEELGRCPVCGKPVRERGKAFGCDTGRECPFVVFAKMSGREITTAEVRELLERGRTKRLHGFRQRGGAVFKAALVLDPDKGVRFDYTRGDDEELPPGAYEPAFDRRLDCPACVARADAHPGYLIAGKAAWGCSRWKDGCALRVPFELYGVKLPEEEARKLFGRRRATGYLAVPLGPPEAIKVCKVLLRPLDDPCWVLEPKG